MTSSPRARRLLRWFPPAWRRRSGDEFAALLDDSLGDADPWIRAGALAVLCAWSIFVVAGIGLQKTSEHWQDVVSGSAHTWAWVAFGTLEILAAVASLLVVVGAVAVLPAVLSFLVAGGWGSVRGSVLRAAATCGVTAAVLGGAVWWAHRLSGPQRNGADPAYSLAALGFALLVAASIATVTVAGVGVVRRLRLPARVLRLEGRLAEAVTAAMVLMAVAAGAWWGVMTSAAPSFLGGAGQMIGIAGLMIVAVVMAALGTRRVLEGLRSSA